MFFLRLNLGPHRLCVLRVSLLIHEDEGAPGLFLRHGREAVFLRLRGGIIM